MGTDTPIGFNNGVRLNEFLTDIQKVKIIENGGQTGAIFDYSSGSGNLNSDLLQLGKDYTAQYDADGKNGISEDEFADKEWNDYAKMCPKSANNLSLQAAIKANAKQSAFKGLDLNHDNKIDQSEMTAYLKAVDSSDGQGDGKISFDTFAATDVSAPSFGDRLRQAWQSLQGK